MNCTSDKAHRMAKRFMIALMIVPLIVAGIAALGWVVMLLWNALLPELFVGAQPISFYQALGILLLSKILFGSFRGGNHRHWKEPGLRWENITPEEREQIRGKLGRIRSRWGSWCESQQRGDNAPKDAPTHPE